MEKAAPEMCEVCGRKKATHHLCQPGAVPHSISLCNECEKTHAPVLVKDFIAQVKNAVCRFCGNKAMTMDSLPGIGDELDTSSRYLCFSCSAESNRIGMEKFRSFESEFGSLPSAELLKQLREFTGQIDTHMRRWVIQRDN